VDWLQFNAKKLKHLEEVVDREFGRDVDNFAYEELCNKLQVECKEDPDSKYDSKLVLSIFQHLAKRNGK
jgi:hypothetical protein